MIDPYTPNVRITSYQHGLHKYMHEIDKMDIYQIEDELDINLRTASGREIDLAAMNRFENLWKQMTDSDRRAYLECC